MASTGRPVPRSSLGGGVGSSPPSWWLGCCPFGPALFLYIYIYIYIYIHIYIYRSRQKGKLKPPGTPLGHLRVSILAWRKIARPVDVTTGVPLHFGGLVVARCLGLSFSLSFPFSLDQYLYLWLCIYIYTHT